MRGGSPSRGMVMKLMRDGDIEGVHQGMGRDAERLKKAVWEVPGGPEQSGKQEGSERL